LRRKRFNAFETLSRRGATICDRSTTPGAWGIGGGGAGTVTASKESVIHS